MTFEPLYIFSFAFAFLVIVVAKAFAAKIESQMKGAHSTIGQTTRPLRPVEIGYMLRGGDTNHALLVMGVDLLQRAAKLQLGAAIPEPAEYEKKMWTLAKDTAKDWAMKKVETHMPPDMKKNPVGFVKKIYDLYQFCTKSLKLVVKDIIADPRQLKRYFSAAGVMRLLADFISAGYQNAFDSSLRNYLVDNNLLVSEENRMRASSKLAAISFSTFALILVFTMVAVGLSSGTTPMILASIVLAGSSILASFFITGIFAVREFLPYLTEFESLSIILNRDSWRLNVLKTGRKAMMVVLTFLALAASTLVFIACYLILSLLGLKNPQQLIFVGVFMAFPSLNAFLLLIRSWKLRNTEVATASGEATLTEARTRLSKLSPIASLTQVLKEEDYNPIFSELMALYGIEALILLA